MGGMPQRLHLPEIRVPGKRLGRHIHHDPRSLAFALPAGTPQTVQWDARIPILDQGDLGSCTGNATVGALGTGPLFEALPPDLQQRLGEPLAVKIYSEATRLDNFRGSYPPDDTGSDGLDAAKAAKADGFLSGYQHATSLAACYTAIAAGPFITGVSWMSGMDDPDAEGVVHATGFVRGGHEVCVVGYDATAGLWKVRNSWGDAWGKGGYFYLPDEDYSELLAEQGDATTLVPITAPAPQPNPPAPPEPSPTPPEPTPTPTPPSPDDPLAGLDLAALDAWGVQPHHYHLASVASRSWNRWRTATRTP